MDATIVSAVINGAATLGAAVLEKWTGQKSEESSQKETSEALIPHYMEYRQALTEPMVVILHTLENSNYDMPPSHLRQRVYPDLVLPPESLTRFDSEFKYRIEYTTLLGCTHRIGTSEYSISHLGKAFLRQAREKGDYKRVLS